MNPPARRLGAALAAAALLSACSPASDGTATPGPTGQTTSDSVSGELTTVGPVQLLVPEGWQADPDAAASGQDASFQAPAPEGQTPPQGLGVVLDTAQGDAQVVAQLHAATTQSVFPGIQPGPRRDVDVPGAAGAVRLDWYLEPSGAERPGGSLYDLVVVTEDGQEILVRLATSDPPRDPALADRVLGSVRVPR